MESGFQLAKQQAAAYEAQSGRFMNPSARLVVDSLGLRPGNVVLDLACGTGLIARHALPMVQPGGRVVGADVNPAMLAAAESLLGNGVEWVEAPAEHLPLDDATFTHVICQQGFQFFPDALAAAKEAHRVLQPRGTLVATIWATPGHNPYIETQLSLLAELNNTIAASAAAATPASADDRLQTLASEAGFRDIDLSILEHTVEVENLRAFFIEQTATTPWATVLAVLSQAHKDRLATEFETRLAEHATSGGHLLPFSSHMILCHR